MIESLIAIVITIIVVGMVLWALTYAVDNIPMLAPFRQVAKVIIVVLGVLILALLLLRVSGVSLRI